MFVTRNKLIISDNDLFEKGVVYMRSIITISREFGSGGREIGKKLADRFGVPFYDKELLEIASKESGIARELFVKSDESYTNSFLYSLVMGNYPVSPDGRLNPELPLNHKIFLAQFETIKKLAEKGPCVIVGRCADYVLKDEPNVVNFFVSGNMFEKKRRILERYDIEKNKVEDFIKKTDKRRASYYNYYTDMKWGEARHFDLCVNSSRSGIEGAVDLMYDYVGIKENKPAG
jgi:cytidylate kinase